MFYENNLAKLSGPKYLLKVSFFGNGSVALTSTAWGWIERSHLQTSIRSVSTHDLPITYISAH